MALRNQPYFPLYVQDYLTDEKLNNCSAATQGIYIKILCVLHKQDEYGCILFKQNPKQKLSKVEYFAYKLSKQLTFELNEIREALEELLEENVLSVDDEKLYQRRMVKDNKISEARSKAGKSGGGNPILSKDLFKQNHKQNPENENEFENEFEVFRKMYPGTKKGLSTEFVNFKKKHKDWKTIIPILTDRLKQQISAKEQNRVNGAFVPEWKNLQTYINQRDWEAEIPIAEPKLNGSPRETYTPKIPTIE